MFSERENQILKIIGKKKITVYEITNELFLRDINAPIDADITVRNSIDRINKKCTKFKLSWRLNKFKIPGSKIKIQRIGVKC